MTMPDETARPTDRAQGQGVEARAAFDRLLADLRPKLHRYCARMTGSVIDGEDVVQEAILKAIEAFPAEHAVFDPEAWLFRITHNAALDYLRRRARQQAVFSHEDLDMAIDPMDSVRDREVAAASLRMFMRLPVGQRSSVILMDVLGYSLQEMGSITQMSIPALKAGLHRGRARLRELAAEPDDCPPPELAEPDRKLLSAYFDHFNAHDFDAVRSMLADEVRLDLVNRSRRSGRKQVGVYFENYDRLKDWHLVPGLVDRRPAVLVRGRCDPLGETLYFIVLDWAGNQLVSIRDFRYARYATEGAELVALS
jgi:RNA polymerase sigma-70 factor, ECF subfamily